MKGWSEHPVIDSTVSLAESPSANSATVRDFLFVAQVATSGKYFAALSLLARKSDRRAMLAANRLRQSAASYRRITEARHLSLGRDLSFAVNGDGSLTFAEVA